MIFEAQPFVLVLDDEIGFDAMTRSPVFDPKVHAERLCLELTERGASVLPFNGKVLEPDNSMRLLVDPNECAAEVLRRFRLSLGPQNQSTCKPSIVLDLEWFGRMDFGEKLLESLWQTNPSGLSRVAVYSKWTSKKAKELFFQKYEVMKPHCIDKSLGPTAVIRAFFPDSPP